MDFRVLCNSLQESVVCATNARMALEGGEGEAGGVVDRAVCLEILDYPFPNQVTFMCCEHPGDILAKLNEAFGLTQRFGILNLQICLFEISLLQ